MYTTVKNGNFYAAQYKEIVCNTDDELKNIDRKNVAPGSKAMVLTDGGEQKNYILSNSGEWIAIDSAVNYAEE